MTWVPTDILKKLDVNEYDCAQCGENVPTCWDAAYRGSCALCDGDVVDAGREKTVARRFEREFT